jgi:hypothetical protein
MSKLDYYIHDEADARASVPAPDELQQGELVRRFSLKGMGPSCRVSHDVNTPLVSDAGQHTAHGGAVWLGRPLFIIGVYLVPI